MNDAVSALARHRLARARESLRDGQVLIEAGSPGGAVNRFYCSAIGPVETWAPEPRQCEFLGPLHGVGPRREGRLPFQSGTRISPDLLLTVERGGVTRFIVLDAKYRTSRFAVLDAMASAHIYQDSLRIGTSRPDAALLLVPSGGGAVWLEDELVQDQHRVGVVPLAPGGVRLLPRLVRRLFTPPQG